MSTKHLYGSQDGLVLKSLSGAVALNPALRLHAPSKSVYVKDPSPNAGVAVISGGGAGHEPAHAGYTGRGMLAASVSGEIFASPSAKQICDTIALTKSPAVLVVINNYTGDRLNFGLAIEKARARGILVESIMVADDVSLPEARGLAGNVLVCKVLGAMAERGADLPSLKSLGDALVKNLASVGVGLDHCHAPGREEPASMDKGECEIGLGLHNERGVSREKLKSPEELVKKMVDMIQASRGASSPFITKEDRSVLFINNLGGMSQLEMNAAMKECVDQLDHIGINPERIFMSSYMTSLNAPGFSISLLNVSAAERELVFDPNILQLLDDTTEAVAWVGSPVSATMQAVNTVEGVAFFMSQEMSPEEGRVSFWRDCDISCDAVRRGIISACNAVLDAEKELTQYDAVVGDGDCGQTFAAAVLSLVNGQDSDVSQLSPSSLVNQLGRTLEDSMGGTIGALFAIFFFSWSSALSDNISSVSEVFEGLNRALNSLLTYTPAKVGDCTLMDALIPFCKASSENRVKAACEGAESTRTMRATLGRAAYVPKEEQGDIPDPGAIGVAALVKGFYEGYYSKM